MLTKRTVIPETGIFRSAGTSKKYRRTVYSGAASDGKIMKIRNYRVLDPGYTMHACDLSRESSCLHACMSMCTGLAPLEREKPCSNEFLIQNNFFIEIILSNFHARAAPRAAVNHLTMQHGFPARSSTPMVWLHLVTPLPTRVSGFSTRRLRLTLFLF